MFHSGTMSYREFLRCKWLYAWAFCHKNSDWHLPTLANVLRHPINDRFKGKYPRDSYFIPAAIPTDKWHRSCFVTLFRPLQSETHCISIKSDSIGCSSTLSRQIIEPFSNHQINKQSPMALVENTCTLIRDILASGSKVTMFLLFCTLFLLISYTKAQSIDDLILAASNNNEDIYDKAYKGELLPLDSLEDYQLGLGAKNSVSIFLCTVYNVDIIESYNFQTKCKCDKGTASFRNFAKSWTIKVSENAVNVEVSYSRQKVKRVCNVLLSTSLWVKKIHKLSKSLNRS